MLTIPIHSSLPFNVSMFVRALWLITDSVESITAACSTAPRLLVCSLSRSPSLSHSPIKDTTSPHLLWIGRKLSFPRSQLAPLFIIFSLSTPHSRIVTTFLISFCPPPDVIFTTLFFWSDQSQLVRGAFQHFLPEFSSIALEFTQRRKRLCCQEWDYCTYIGDLIKNYESKASYLISWYPVYHKYQESQREHT